MNIKSKLLQIFSRNSVNKSEKNVKTLQESFYDFEIIDFLKNNKATIKPLENYIIASISIALALFIALPIVSARENKKYDITDNKAEEYFYAGDYSKSINEYLNLAKKDKLSPMWDVKIAGVYSVQGDMINSKRYLKRAKEAQSKNSDILNYIIFTEFMNKDYDVALLDGEEALKIDGKNPELMKTMFTVYMANNELDKAKALIAKYPVNNKSAYDMAVYARMLMLVEDWDGGFKELKAAWYVNRDEYKIYDVLSQIAAYNRDALLEKISVLSTAEPSEVAYKMWLAKIYSAGEETAELAQGLLNDINGKNIGNIEVKLIEATILQNQKKVDEANTLISQIIKANSNSYSVLHTAGWFYLNQKDYSLATKYCKLSILKNKNYPDNYGFLMPEILKAEGKSIEGEPYFRTALLYEPYNYNTMLNIANYYWYTTKNSDKAMEYFKMAELVKPTDPEIIYNIASIEITNNKPDEAIPLLNQCIKLDATNPKYYRALGTIYMLKKDFPNAIIQIKNAYHANENDILALNNAGCYYISIEGIDKLPQGLFNLQKAYEGLKPSDSQYTRDSITENYNKAKKLNDDYQNGSDNQVLTIPEFVFFY
ncbi:MAG TPA: tetratricopeptide repeat protein [Clostridiaceae bacterium]